MKPDEIAELCKGKDAYFSTFVGRCTYTVTLFYTDVHLYRNSTITNTYKYDSRAQAFSTYEAIKNTLCELE